MLHDLLQHRRAVRYFDTERQLDTERVRRRLEEAALAPTSSNMQLWECYHITDPELIARLAPAYFDQSAVRSASQLVAFAITPQRWRAHAAEVLAFQREDLPRHFPEDKWPKYLALQENYYGKLIPLLYRRGWGLWGQLRRALFTLVGLARPVPRETTEAAMRTVLHKSCALVIQSFLLGMSEEGYDTCPLEGYDSRRVARLLGLERGSELTMIIACGYRSTERPLGGRFRLPFAQQYHRIGS
ncbi:nitroreductase family protein [Porphyromonas sp.]